MFPENSAEGGISRGSGLKMLTLSYSVFSLIDRNQSATECVTGNEGEIREVAK